MATNTIDEASEGYDSGVGDSGTSINKTRTRLATVKYTPLYNKYYTASDFIIKVRGDSTPIWLDKASGVAVSESLSSNPIYTLGDSRVNFFSRGNQVVTGFISVNLTSIDYMSKVLANINNKIESFKYLTAKQQMALSAEALKEYLAKKEAYEKQKVDYMSTLGFADYPLFTIELEYNNSDAIELSSSMTREIIGCRIIGFETGVDIGGDGHLVDGYKFIAKEIL